MKSPRFCMAIVGILAVAGTMHAGSPALSMLLLPQAFGQEPVPVSTEAAQDPELLPMPWAEKDMRIVLSEADHLRLAVPLCGVVTEVVKSVKIERGWPTPTQRET